MARTWKDSRKSKRSKYNSKRVTTESGTYASKHEYKRFCELKLLQEAGEISDLRQQVRFSLIPAQYAAPDGIYRRGAKRGQPKPGKLLERPCDYVADFTYTTKDGEFVVEDAKGYRLRDYKIKRKLMLYMRGIRVKET